MGKQTSNGARRSYDSLMWATWDLQKDMEETYAVVITWVVVAQVALRGRYVLRCEARSKLNPSAEKPLEAYSRLYPGSDSTSMEGALFAAMNCLAKQLDDRRKELIALAGF